jgi:hypothetical protein
MLAGHAGLLLADFAGLQWTRPVLFAGGAAALLALVGPLRAAFRARRDPEPLDPSWADAAAAIAVAAFAVSAFALRSSFTDFVYHWGLKGHRFFLTRGIDEAFLARPENGYLHPDYPNLLPELFAAAALLAGRFDPRALMLFSPILVLALLAAVRAHLLGATLPRFVRRAIFAGLACSLGAFSIGYLQAGSADPPFALAVALAAGALLLPPGRAAAIQLGLAAAFAAAVKIEGLPFAALALAAFVVRAAVRDRSSLRDPATWIGLLAPTAAVVAPWAIQARALELFQGTNSGAFDLGRERRDAHPSLAPGLDRGVARAAAPARRAAAGRSDPRDALARPVASRPARVLPLRVPQRAVRSQLLRALDLSPPGAPPAARHRGGAGAGVGGPPRPTEGSRLKAGPRADRRGGAAPAFRSLTRPRADLDDGPVRASPPAWPPAA